MDYIKGIGGLTVDENEILSGVFYGIKKIFFHCEVMNCQVDHILQIYRDFLYI